MLNSEDQHTPVDYIEQERNGSETTSPRKGMDRQAREVIVQAQRDLEHHLRRGVKVECTTRFGKLHK